MPVLYTLRSIRSTMTATPQPYPAYKPSGVEWLGDVPTHWEVVQLGRIGVFSKGSGGTKDDEVPDGIPCVRYGDLYTTHKSFICQTRSYVSPAKASAYTPIHRGDVLFPTSGETIEEIGKSAVNLLDTQVLCGGDTIIFRPTIPMEPKFAGYALDCPAAQTQKSLMGRGITIMHIYSGQLKYLWLSLPPLPEQTAIVRYLDYADRRIRRYVSARRKLIALLEEERQAIVNRAVTRGLDPSIALKPSGVEWLGHVPAHWEVRRLKTLCQMRSGEGITAESIEATGNYPVYGGNGLRGYCSSFTHDGAFALIGRQGALCGNVHIARGQFWASEHAVVATLHQSHVLEWFAEALRVMNLNQYSIAAAQPGLAVERVLNLHLSVPPFAEQTAIAEYMDRATTGIDAAIGRARRQIEMLQEHRSRLIADVVTGKLEVRAAAAQLPAEAGGPDPVEVGRPLGEDVDGDHYDATESAEDLAMESGLTA